MLKDPWLLLLTWILFPWLTSAFLVPHTKNISSFRVWRQLWFHSRILAYASLCYVYPCPCFLDDMTFDPSIRRDSFLRKKCQFFCPRWYSESAVLVSARSGDSRLSSHHPFQGAICLFHRSHITLLMGWFYLTVKLVWTSPLDTYNFIFPAVALCCSHGLLCDFPLLLYLV